MRRLSKTRQYYRQSTDDVCNDGNLSAGNLFIATSKMPIEEPPNQPKMPPVEEPQKPPDAPPSKDLPPANDPTPVSPPPIEEPPPEDAGLK